MNVGMRTAAALTALAPLSVATAASGAAVAASTNATGKASVLKSLSILKQADLDFGEVVAAGSGTAVINPTTGAIATSGGVTHAGTIGHPASFTATGSKNSVVLIRIPTTAVTLSRLGGGGTMTVSNWTLDGSTNRKIPQNNAFNFAVGGTLNVGAGQADGDYSGTFSVTVQYP
jgi:hypothetical protein